MAKKRLNMGHRDMLKQLAFSKISSPETEKAMEKAKERLHKLAITELSKQVSEDDLKTLKKFDLVTNTTRLSVLFHDLQTGQSHHNMIRLSTEVSVPDRYSWKMRSKYDGALHKSLKAYDKAVIEHEQAIKSIKDDYTTLIKTSKTYEDVVEVWSEAEELRQQICGTGTALAVINTELVDRIKKDVQNRVSKGV